MKSLRLVLKYIMIRVNVAILDRSSKIKVKVMVLGGSTLKVVLLVVQNV